MARGIVSSMATSTPRSTSDKVRENRLRRMAERQGLALHKSPRRDPRALDYGLWNISNPRSRRVAGGHTGTGFDMTLDDVERYLTEGGQ